MRTKFNIVDRGILVIENKDMKVRMDFFLNDISILYKTYNVVHNGQFIFELLKVEPKRFDLVASKKDDAHFRMILKSKDEVIKINIRNKTILIKRGSNSFSNIACLNKLAKVVNNKLLLDSDALNEIL